MPMSIEINEIMSKFDFALTIQYNQSINQLSCTVDASLDLFDATTLNKIAQRFHSILEQLFNVADVQMNKSIYELSLILPYEKLLMRSTNNTQVLFAPVPCIHYEFVSQAMKHPQKLAIELDDQSLTYVELLYYAQVLFINLLSNQKVLPGDIICQCVERSISMVSSLQKSFFSKKRFYLLGDRDGGNSDGWWCILSPITSRSTSAFICTYTTNPKSSCSCSSFDKNYIH
jgi:non-ribosomal peptide synthetase component F